MMICLTAMPKPEPIKCDGYNLVIVLTGVLPSPCRLALFRLSLLSSTMADAALQTDKGCADHDLSVITIQELEVPVMVVYEALLRVLWPVINMQWVHRIRSSSLSLTNNDTRLHSYDAWLCAVSSCILLCLTSINTEGTYDINTTWLLHFLECMIAQTESDGSKWMYWAWHWYELSACSPEWLTDLHLSLFVSFLMVSPSLQTAPILQLLDRDVTANILSFLKRRTLCEAMMVCVEWGRVVSGRRALMEETLKKEERAIMEQGFDDVSDNELLPCDDDILLDSYGGWSIDSDYDDYC